MPLSGGAPPLQSGSAGDRDALAAALTRDLGISEAQALHNVDVQARARGIVRTLQTTLGDGFAGVWFDNASGRFRVGVAASTDQQAVTTALVKMGVAADAQLVPVRSTWKNLEAVEATRVQSLQPEIANRQAIVGIDAPDNAVTVTLAPDVSATRRHQLEAESQAASVTVNVRTGPAGLFDRAPKSCRWPYCDRPLGGGTYIENGLGRCTGGFGGFGQRNLYLITAGHCLKDGGGSWDTYQPNGTFRSIGSPVQWMFDSRGDQATILINGPYFNVAGGVSAKIAAWTQNANYLIYGGGYSYYGQSLCRYGATTQRSCGVDSDPNTINVTVGGIGHQTYNTACSNGGDSGGPFVAGNVGYGLLSTGVIQDCPALGTWYTEALYAASALGVQVSSAG